VIRPTEIFLVVAIGLFWGLNWPAVKTILGEVPPWTLRAIGLSTGALLLMVVAYAARQSLATSRREMVWLAGAGLFTVFGFNIFAAFGQLFTATSTATIVAFTMPMWASFLSALFLGEGLSTARIFSLGLGLLGLFVLVSDDAAAILSRPTGILFMLGAALSWAVGTVLLKAHTWTVKPLARSAWLVTFSAIPTAIGAFLFETPLQQSLPSPAVLAVFAYHIVFPMVVCHAAWVVLVERLPVQLAVIGTLLIPIVGVLSSGLLLGDHLSWSKIAALALVLSSIVLAFRKPSAQAAGS